MEVNQWARTNYFINDAEMIACGYEKSKIHSNLSLQRLMVFLSEDTIILFLVLYLV